MLGNREMTLDDYLVILRRRFWVLVIPTLLGPAIAYSISLWIPNQYTSQTLVLVEQQKVPESFVKPMMTDALNQRLITMQQRVLSRTRLQPLIDKFGLYQSDSNRVPMEELVGRLRRSILVIPVRPTPTQPGQPPGLSGFHISFTVDNPRLAQQVCAEVTSMFMEENLRVREQRAEGTTEFLAKQLGDAKAKLDEQDAKLAWFKKRYLGQLPGQEQANLSILMGLNAQLEAATQLLSRLQQDKSYMESLLAQQLATSQATQSANSPATMEQQLSALQNLLMALEARYTSDHPDVIKTKNDIALLKKRIEQAEVLVKSKTPGDVQQTTLAEPPQIEQLRNQIRLAQQSLAEKTREQQRLQEQIKIYQARVQLSPVVEQEYKELTRDYQTAQGFYNDLLAKKTQSEIATDLERRQQGEQFRVMDPANLPIRPSYPNRILFTAGGFGGGLGLGLGIALLLELRDKSLRNERDVEFYLQLPTLALLPALDVGRGRTQRSWRRSEKEHPELHLGAEN